LDEKSVKIMAKLMLAMMELNMSLYEFFEGCIYEQMVKSKTKEDVIEIMKTESFFVRLQERGVRKKNNVHENLQNFLQLDQNFPNLLTIRKIAKTLDEMAKNEELMEGILAAVDEADGGGDYVQDQDDQRLGTIGEEEGQKDEASAQGTVP
jgi:phosphoglycerate-specific signal transduction histidine kinase